MRLGDSDFHSDQNRRDAWNKLVAGNELKQLKQLALNGRLSDYPIRSICWKGFLGCCTGDVATWGKQLGEARQRYDKLIAQYMVDPHQAEVSDPTYDNPLSQHEDSSWNQFFQNSELQKEINQDIVRTYPEKEFFQKKNIRAMMLRILFIYAKTTPQLCYRQGMHELLAPVIYLFQSEKVAPEAVDEDDLSSVLMNGNYVEHDAWYFFSQLMEIAGKWFGIRTADTPLEDTRNSPVLRKCTYLQQVLLKEKDPQLFTYLEDLKVEPQLYALRWIRLLVGREFHLDDLLSVWDALFAFGEDLYLLDYLCIAMLTYLRSQLLSMDQSSCLRRLMKYPPVEDVHLFVERALQLCGRTEHLQPTPGLTTSSNTGGSVGSGSGGVPPSPTPRRKQQVDPLAALLESIPETVDDLKLEVIRHRKTQYHMGKRLERIAFIFQSQLVAATNQSREELESALLALAELKQVNAILSGLLPDDESEGIPIVNPMKPSYSSASNSAATLPSAATAAATPSTPPPNSPAPSYSHTLPPPTLSVN